MSRSIEPTEELAVKLFKAQLLCMKDHVDSYLHYGGASDDGWDYLMASLELANRMGDIVWNQDLNDLGVLLNKADEIHNNYACDGVANEFYELDCAAAPKEVM